MTTVLTPRQKKIIKASNISLLGNASLAVIKIIAGYLSGSLAVVADGIDSLSDVFTSFITLFTAKIITRPPNRRHPYGYDKADTVASKLVAFVIFFFKCFSKDTFFAYMKMSVVFIIFAHFFQQTFVYSFMLMLFIPHIKLFTFMMKATFENRSMMLVTLIFILLVVYIYAQFGFEYLSSDFYMRSIEETACSSLAHCLLTVINFGPRMT